MKGLIIRVSNAHYFDVDFLDGKITVHGFEQMQCTKCSYIFMNAEQAQLYEDWYKHFINFYEE